MSIATSFDQRVIEAIQSGTLQELKRCCLGSSDVNRPISISKDVPVVCQSPNPPFPAIRAPTPVIYAILCERPDLLQYLLTTKKPNLSIRINGWTPLHYAAITHSHKCLEMLLKYEYIQENIDTPTEDSGVPTVPGRGTTALHIATSNRRHAAVFLLTQPLPIPEYDGQGMKIENRSPGDQSYEPANALGLSAPGNMPLHMAAYLGDWDLCQIILHAADDPTVKNAAGKTPADIARERQFGQLALKLERNDVESIDELRFRYLAEARPKREARDFGELETSEYATVEEVMALKKMIIGLSETVRQLSIRIDALSAGVITQSRPSEVTVVQCQACGEMRTERCDSCGGRYCHTCWTKACHPCARV
jgi:ankyrin repeat protein